MSKLLYIRRLQLFLSKVAALCFPMNSPSDLKRSDLPLHPQVPLHHNLPFVVLSPSFKTQRSATVRTTLLETRSFSLSNLHTNRRKRTSQNPGSAAMLPWGESPCQHLKNLLGEPEHMARQTASHGSHRPQSLSRLRGVLPLALREPLHLLAGGLLAVHDGLVQVAVLALHHGFVHRLLVQAGVPAVHRQGVCKSNFVNLTFLDLLKVGVGLGVEETHIGCLT